VKVGGTANPELVPLVREWRGPGSATQIVVGCVSAIDEDGDWARERVRELWAAGADSVELGTPQGRTTPTGIALICERVLPLLRSG